jgi:protein-disulfide isomerase
VPLTFFSNGLLGATFALAFVAGAMAEEYPQMSAPKAAESAALTDPQKVAIEDVVRNLLAHEPELVVKATQEMRRRQEAEIASKNQAAVMSNRDKLLHDPAAPIAGNPDGDVAVVEFFDYQCGYCKMAQEAVAKLLNTDKNVRFVYKEYPILGPASVLSSKAALASMRQGKYAEFHDNLMATKGHFTEDVIFEVAEKTGLDVTRLKQDMADESIEKAMHVNIAVAGEIGARGTPAFIIGEQMFGGAMKYEEMQQAVGEAREKQKQ